MIETPVRTSGASETENLRAALARGDALAGTVLPILRHLLGHDSGTVLGDETIARVRAMLAGLTRELLGAVGGSDDPADADALFHALLGASPLLAHLHGQALEWALAERLERCSGIDPVIAPLLQSGSGALDPALSALSRRLLTAQARWCQAQRLMAAQLLELPADALHAALLALRSAVSGAERTEAPIRARYDEGGTRLGLAARLIVQADAGDAALDLEQAGATLFITALALRSGQDRDIVALATQEAQATRLALMLIAAGLVPHAAERQIELLHERPRLLPELEAIAAPQAAALLHSAIVEGG